MNRIYHQARTVTSRLHSFARTDRDVFLVGLLFWIGFCFVAVFVRGVRWDEEYEMAQVVLGRVAYPQDHPLFRCTRGALNLQIYVTTGILWLTDNPILVCGFRNILFLLATVMPMYCIGTKLASRALYGHIAVLIALLGIQDDFFGNYRMSAWPNYFSTGHVGSGYALIVLYMILSRHWRTAMILLGLMPVVHVGQMPIPLAFVGLISFAAVMGPHRRRFFRAVPWAIASLGVCAVVWFGRGLMSVPPPMEGPYFSPIDAQTIWASYVGHDSHRALPGGPVKYANAFIVTGAALLVMVAAARLEGRAGDHRNAWRETFLYLCCVATAVWGVMAIHFILRESIPYVLISWMPYRFTNHAIVLLIAAIPGLIAAPFNRRQSIEIGGRAVSLQCSFMALPAPYCRWCYPRSFTIVTFRRKRD